MLFCAPPILRREVQLWCLGVVLFFMGIASLFLVCSEYGQGQVRFASYFAAPSLTIGGVVLMAVSFVRRGQRLRLVKAMKFAMCPSCGHDLNGIRGNACPECGVTVNLSLLRSFWARYIGIHLDRRWKSDMQSAPVWLRNTIRRCFLLLVTA